MLRITQIDENERVIVDEPGYLVNLTRLLPATPPRTIANYMMWRAARASLDYFTEAARKIQLEFAKNITGKKSGTERWKTCTGESRAQRRGEWMLRYSRDQEDGK